MKGFEKVETTPIDRKKLAEENHNLIYWFCNKNHLNLEEWYDIIAIGYMKAINQYDEAKDNKISTYLVKCMKNEYLLKIREINTKGRIPKNCIYSLDMEYGTSAKGGNDNIETALKDIIPDENSEFENEICFRHDLENAFNAINLSERYRNVYFLRLNGYKLREIAEIEKCSRQNVNRICQDVEARLKKYLVGKSGEYF